MVQIKVLKTFLLVLIPLTFLACSKPDFKVKVKYINKTGNELNELTIGGNRIGKLADDAETEYIPYKTYQFDSGSPDVPIEAIIGNEKTYDESGSNWCGTNKNLVSEGTFEIEIVRMLRQDKIVLRLVKQ